MANKKLKLEVELETAKAKRQANEIAGSSMSPSVPTAGSVSTDRLTKATQDNSRQMLSMTKAFAGMAAGLAASYASTYFDRGSTAERTLSYGGSILTGAMAGASMGAMAGPQGAVIGALAGGAMAGTKTYMDRQREAEMMSEDFNLSEGIYEENKAFSDMMKAITSPFNTNSIEEKLSELSSQYIDELNHIEQIKELISEAIGNGNAKEVSELRGDLDRARARKDSIWNVAEKLDSSAAGTPRAGMSALSALQRFGGGSVQTSYGVIDVGERKLDETNRLLREIREITGKKGWY